MSILLLSALFLSALCFSWFRFLRSTVIALLSAVFVLLFVGQGWMPGLFLNGLQSTPPLQQVDWKERNVIVVLGIGSVKWPNQLYLTTHPLGFSRLHEAARLYFLCKQALKSCSILASGGDPQGNGISEAEVMKRELLEIALPESDILIESKSKNTFQNAQFSSELLRSQNFNQTIVVTSGIHLGRAVLYFSHFNIHALGSPSDRLEPIPSLFPIAHNFAFNDIAIHEYSGFLRYRFYNWMGWNSASSTPGTP